MKVSHEGQILKSAEFHGTNEAQKKADADSVARLIEEYIGNKYRLIVAQSKEGKFIIIE